MVQIVQRRILITLISIGMLLLRSVVLVDLILVYDRGFARLRAEIMLNQGYCEVEAITSLLFLRHKQVSVNIGVRMGKGVSFVQEMLAAVEVGK